MQQGCFGAEVQSFPSGPGGLELMAVLITQFAGTKEIYRCLWIHTGQGAGLLEIRRAKGCASVREREHDQPSQTRFDISFSLQFANEVWF